MSRSLPAPASACNIASTGVAPIPAEKSTTGRRSSVRQKSPRGAAAVITIPGRMWVCSQPLTNP